MGATENSGFNSEVQRNLGLDFVTKQHKNFKQFTQLSVSDMLTRVNFPTAYLRYGAGPLRRADKLCNGIMRWLGVCSLSVRPSDIQWYCVEMAETTNKQLVWKVAEKSK